MMINNINSKQNLYRVNTRRVNYSGTYTPSFGTTPIDVPKTQLNGTKRINKKFVLILAGITTAAGSILAYLKIRKNHKSLEYISEKEMDKANKLYNKALYDIQDPSLKEQYLLESLSIKEKALQDKTHPLLFNNLEELAKLYRKSGKYEKSLGFFDRCIAAGEKKPKHSRNDYLIISLQRIAAEIASEKLDDAKVAEDRLKKAIVLAEDIKFGGLNIIELYKDLKKIQQDQGKEHEADQTQKKIDQIFDDNISQLSEAVSKSRKHDKNNTGLIYWADRGDGGDGPLTELAKYYIAAGKLDKAEEVYKEAVNIVEENLANADVLNKTYGGYAAFNLAHHAVNYVYKELGSILEKQDKYTEAIDTYEKCADLYKVLYDPVSSLPKVGDLYLQIGDLYAAHNEADNAEEAYKYAYSAYGHLRKTEFDKSTMVEFQKQVIDRLADLKKSQSQPTED